MERTVAATPGATQFAGTGFSSGISASLTSFPLLLFVASLLTAFRRGRKVGRTRAAASPGVPSKSAYEYDLLVIGCGVGGHAVAVEARRKGLKVGVIEAGDVGGTCVNRGCVPSKALLSAAGHFREMNDTKHLKAMGLTAGPATYDRAQVAKSANDLAVSIKGALSNSLKALQIDLLEGAAQFVDEHTLMVGGHQRVSAQHIVVATGSKPLVPPGITVDEKRVVTSDAALKLPYVPDQLGIVGSGYIGLEFADVFNALGSNISMYEAMDTLFPAFDPDIRRLAKRLLLDGRKITSHTSVFASVHPPKNERDPLQVQLKSAADPSVVESTQEVDMVLVSTGRKPINESLAVENLNVQLARGGFIPTDEHMRVLRTDGTPSSSVFCIGDANGKMMLAHAASAQGLKVVSFIGGEPTQVYDNQLIPAACFTHPEIAFVGLTEPQAKELYPGHVKVAKSHFKANTKAVAHGAGDGIAKLIFTPEGRILGCHIMGLHASDMIHEVSNAMTCGLRVSDLSACTHAHPTVAEVMEELYRAADRML